MSQHQGVAVVAAILAAGIGPGWSGGAFALLAAVALLAGARAERDDRPRAIATPLSLTIGSSVVTPDDTRWHLTSVVRSEQPGRPAVLSLDLTANVPR